MMNPKDTGIALDFDMSDISMISGDIKEILPGNSEDYVTKIGCVIPISPKELRQGDYTIDYNGNKIIIRLEVITKPEDDPILEQAAHWNFGVPGTAIGTLPFSVFTDNHGEYPCSYATIVFPYRLASWISNEHETGFRFHPNYEELSITGAPFIQEKITALVVLNRTLRELLKEEFKTITYDEVTVFGEAYFRKPETKTLILKITALASKSAYKDAIARHFLSGLDNTYFEIETAKLSEQYLAKQINNESDLLKVVIDALEKVLKHHIEDRHWIEAFWDGEREVEIDGKKAIVHKTPKNETRIQPTLHVILHLALSPLGIQVTRESDEGVGTLDFRCFYTTPSSIGISVAIEFKLAHHKKLRNGLSVQLPAYLKAISSCAGIFCVMWFKDDKGKYFDEPKNRNKRQMTDWLQCEGLNASKEKSITLYTSVIDASIKPTASTM